MYMDIFSFSDEELVTYIRDENKEAFAHLIDRYEPKLIRYITYLVNDDEKAKDIVQDTFIKVYVNLNNFQVNKKFSSWVYRIAHNEAINLINKEKKLVNFDTTNLLDELVSTFKKQEEVIFEEELVNDLKEVLTSIDSKYKDILVLYLLEQKGYEEISEILRIPTSTVGTRIKRGKIQVQNLLKQKGYGRY